MRLASIFICLLLVSTAFAVDQGEIPPGTIIRPGAEPSSALYINSGLDSRAAVLKDRLNAFYTGINAQMPSEAIIVQPAGFTILPQNMTETRIADAARDILSSMAMVPPGCQLELVSQKFAMNRLWFVNFKKSVGGIPIEDAGINMTVSRNGNIMMLWGNFDGIDSAPMPFSLNQLSASEIARRGLSGAVTHQEFEGKSILPLYFNGKTEYHPVYKYIVVTDEPFAQWEVYVDAQNGEILERTDRVYYDEVSGTVTGMIQPLTPYDPWESRNIPNIEMQFDGYSGIITDSAGFYSFNSSNSNPIDVSVQFMGPYLQVMNSAGDEALITNTVDPPAVYNVHWDDSNSLPPERDAWYAVNTVHKWITTIDTTLTVMDFPMICNVNVNGTCNAYWSGYDRTINFYRAGGGCPNIAQIADVIYHEYGHGITDLMTRPEGPNGAMHEGWSDYIACTITNQQYVGLGFQGPNTYLRDINPPEDRRYPEDWSGESHNDGLIMSGAIWHIRQVLSPYPMGYTDSLWHFARYARTSEFEPYFWAFAALDDDDGDISNGTPNGYTIFHSFGDRHGIGPGTHFEIAVDSVYDSEDTTRVFTVNATITDYFPLVADSILLFYDNGTGYMSLPMTNTGSTWQANIPPQHNRTTVHFYIQALNSAGFRGTSPEDAPASYYSFFVGPDIIPPTVNPVDLPGNTVNLFGPYGPFSISAYDINGINDAAARMHYWVNSEAENVIAMVPSSGDSIFTLTSLNLDRQLFTGDVVHYYFTVRDLAREPNTARLPASGSLDIQMVTSETFEDFERYGMSRWVADSGWVLRNVGHSPTHCLWFSSPRYPDNADASVTMDFDYDLSPYSGVRLTMYNEYIFASGDSCFIEVSNNGGNNWTRVGALTDTLAPIFHFAQFDISSVLRRNAHHYKVRFHFVSDNSNNSVGVFLDDIGWAVDPVTGISDEPVAQIPEKLSLSQNYPNPFNPETKILFSLPYRSHVKLDVFDILGRQIATLVEKDMAAGSYSVIWNGRDKNNAPVSSGVYFYRLTTDQGTRQEKMTLLR